MKTVPHRNYILTSESDIKIHFDYMGYKTDNIPLCQEVANIISHQKFCSNDLSEAIVNESDIETFQPIIDLLNSCDQDDIAGNTPLEKAANLIDKLEKIQEEQSKEESADSDDENDDDKDIEDNENENSSEEPLSESNMSEIIQKFLDFIKEQIESNIKAFIKTLLEKTREEEKVKDTDTDIEFIIDNMPPQIGDNPLKYALLTDEIKKRLNHLAIVGFSKKIAFNNHPQKQTVRNMRHISEVNRLKNVSDYANPLFYKRLVDNALTVKANTPPTVQRIVLMIDDSESMKGYVNNGFGSSTGLKKEYVLAILIDRFEAALKTKQPLIVCKFEVDFYDLQEIRNTTQLETYFKEIGFEGSTTAIDRSLINLNKYLVSKKIDANICVINDGDDYINPNTKLPFVTHSVMLGKHNENLSAVVKNSGGEYIVIK